MGFLAILLLIIILGGGWGYLNIRDRNPGYKLDLKLPGVKSRADELLIGVAKRTITPPLKDTWVDADSNARYEPDKGDRYIDKNGNGKFDAYWMAGFQQNRPASGVHDDIWARAVVFDAGNASVAWVVLDAIGFFHDDVITVRQQIAETGLGIDHVIVSSTHNHEVPDLMGLWGPKLYKSGVNREYMQLVKDRAVEAITEAWDTRRPAFIELAKIDSTASDIVRDSRPPYVLDDAIHLMQFRDAQTDTIFGLLMNWGNHPETLGSDNTQITADFAHYWIDGIERGIEYDGEMKRKGVGGTVIWANGAIGGLMTSLGCTIHDPWLNRDFKKGSFEKARAQGYRLADLVLDAIENGTWVRHEIAQLRLRAKLFEFPVQNKIFKLGGLLGVLDRGFIGMKKVRSEINLLSIGSAWILTLPGEINPEIVNGGIEKPEGADFPDTPLEEPHFRELMNGKYNFVIGLANDEIGYVMPKSQWDTEPPFTYGRKKAFYGEINSLGPDAGPVLHKEVLRMISEF